MNTTQTSTDRPYTHHNMDTDPTNTNETHKTTNNYTPPPAPTHAGLGSGWCLWLC